MNGATYKTVEYCYPSSPIADAFKFKNGCYAVSVGKWLTPYKAVAAFATESEAIAHAEMMPFTYCPHYLLWKKT